MPAFQAAQRPVRLARFHICQAQLAQPLHQVVSVPGLLPDQEQQKGLQEAAHMIPRNGSGTRPRSIE